MSVGRGLVIVVLGLNFLSSSLGVWAFIRWDEGLYGCCLDWRI